MGFDVLIALTHNDAEKIQKELFEFLESLGVNREDPESYGYDVLMKIKHC